MKSGGLCLFQAAKKLRIIGLVSEESIRKEEESRERESNSRKANGVYNCRIGWLIVY